ncbi:MAG: PAS domain S-box protein [Novosphingobium sp.]|nr:MAG: PAS domain S-box protein [Novosphingobium sp.]
MALSMRAHDWTATPLGDPRSWPDGLKIPLRMLLTSRFEMWLGWGDDLHFFYNDAYIPTLGVKHPHALGRPFQEVWAEVYDDVADQVGRVRAGESTWNQALMLLLERSGYQEETYHSFSYSPLYGTEGTVQGMLCVVSEETERIIGERRLETLRQLGMGLVGTTDRAQVRRAVCDVFGTNRRDFPFALIKLAHGESSESFSCCDDGAPGADHVWPEEPPSLREGGLVRLDPAHSWPTGAWSIPPREALILPVPGTGDQPVFGRLFLGLNPYRRDDPDIADFGRLIAGQISGALANIAAFEAERRRADRIWAHSRDLIVVVDSAGIFRAVSPSWETVFGHRADEVVGHPFADFIMSDDLESSTAALATALGEGDLTGYENRFRTRDGSYRWVSWHTAMEDDLVYAYGRDVTEQKAGAAALSAAEDALRQAQKMEAVGQLTGGIAHDFNNLLTGIVGSLDLMQRRIAQGRFDGLERYSQAAIESAQRAAALTQRLLAFSRRQPLDPRLVEPAMLIGGMTDLIHQSLGEAVSLELRCDDEALVTKCDPNQLENAVLNLVINARDAMPHGGKLVIETGLHAVVSAQVAHGQFAQPGTYVAVTVRDEGCGMAPGTIEKVFEPFFTTKPIGSGTGLGLSMVYGFARQSDGFVEIESAVGRGTTVRLCLPWAEGDLAPGLVPSLKPEVVQADQQRTILVVEDEPAVRMLLVDVLEEAGHRVLEADNGAAGLEILRGGEAIDLLITDVGLPGLNGRQLADAGRALDASLKIIFVTGYAHAATGDDDWLSPGMQIVTKPFDIQGFPKRVEEILDET